VTGSAFVILAAGRGTRIGRVGESLHKALVPLGERAVISRLFDLAPKDAEIIICLGHRGDQIREFVRLAHPNIQPTFIKVDGWDLPGGGPGLSLLAAKDKIGERDVVFTSCDTLWEPGDIDGHRVSWAGVAPIPAGTQPARWCRIVEDGERAASILDKVPDPPLGLAYTGAAGIIQEDLYQFWKGVSQGVTVAGERQVTGGLRRLQFQGTLTTRHMHWLDVGDAAAYSRAVTLYSGYDWTKAGEATWVMPNEHRVVKFWDDAASGNRSAERAEYVGAAVPQLVDRGRQMLAYEYVPGVTVYQALETARSKDGVFARLYAWADKNLWRPAKDARDIEIAAYEFYRNKTLERVEQLRPELFSMASDAVARVDWDELVRGVVPVRFHGDFNAGNIIATDDSFIGIDWRGDFAGRPWGDRRYDEAKLLAGCLIHWDRARRGDFRPWEEGAVHFTDVLEMIPLARRRHVQIIGALSLLNSAPLHAAPLDDVLVVRGTRWLEEVL
jgi:NDP-sugar pyrophosphorylase family protein